MRTGFRFLVMMAATIGLMLTAVSFSSKQAAAQTSGSVTINPSDISAAYFNRGYFKKNPGGSWDEFDGRGKVRYTFREVRRDTNSVYLREDSLNVDLQIDAVNRIIYGAWPNQPRHELYRITNMEIEPTSVTAPPGQPVPPTIGTPPPPAETVTTSNLAHVVLPDGELFKTATGWSEVQVDNTVIPYIQLGHDNWSVFLYDDANNNFVQIDTVARKIRQASGGILSDELNITSMSSKRVQVPNRPNVGLRPGAMTQEQRVECAASGGIIERAGILGAERCTKRYNDGGLICTDSSQCQGKCLAGTEDANKNNITGTCQKTDNPFGCYAEVKNGKSEFALCVD